MRVLKVRPSGIECYFGENDIIVSKTDARGIITYANDVFQKISGYNEEELLGQPHNMIRHPEMPQSVFRYLWQTIASGSEIFAYVVNQARNGDHYWVFAHVTPTFDANNQIIGYHSNRRVPDRSAVEAIKPIYALLSAEERKHANPEDGMKAALGLLVSYLTERGVSYDEFVFSLAKEA